MFSHDRSCFIELIDTFTSYRAVPFIKKYEFIIALMMNHELL